VGLSDPLRVTRRDRVKSLKLEVLALEEGMSTFTAIVEQDSQTNLYVGYVPGFPGAHSQGETLDELRENLREVIEMLLEDEPAI
jgi:predicted RNase H-like HicB family nuclease